MKLLREKKIAITAMVLMSFASILYGSYLSIAHERDAVVQTFYSVEFDSLQGSLNRRMEYAQDMVYIGKQYNKLQESANQQADVETTLQAIESLRKAETLSDKYDADLSLDEAVTDLYISLQGTEIKDSSDRDVKQVYNSFQLYSDPHLIEEYNSKATAFNLQLEKFPTNIFKALYHFDKVELYQ